MPVERPPREPIFSLPDDFPCPDFPELDICAVLLPGGVDFADVDLLSMIQPALAPLVPLFNIVETLVAVKACVEAATEMPDPTALIGCIPGLSAAIAKLLALLPQVSVPRLLADLIDCIIRELEKLNRFVLGLLGEIARIAAILERAAELDDPNLNAFAVCATGRVGAQYDDAFKALVVLGRLLGVIRGFLELIGMDDSLVPDFEALSSASIEEVQEPLDSAIESLRTLRGLLPL